MHEEEEGAFLNSLVKELDDTVATLEKQVIDLGEGLGRLLWDLNYAEKEGPEFVLAIVQDWLKMDFCKDIMDTTREIYDHPVLAWLNEHT